MQINIEEINKDVTDNEIIQDYMINSEFDALINRIENSNDERISQSLHYKLNCTVKELTKICEYYKIDKLLKQCKPNKDDIISQIVMFESQPDNSECAARRKSLWFCINELKNDKYMKKYVIW
jgi:hypothetical protein